MPATQIRHTSKGSPSHAQRQGQEAVFTTSGVDSNLERYLPSLILGRTRPTEYLASAAPQRVIETPEDLTTVTEDSPQGFKATLPPDELMATAGDPHPYYIPSKNQVRVTLQIREVRTGQMVGDDSELIF